MTKWFKKLKSIFKKEGKYPGSFRDGQIDYEEQPWNKYH